MKMSVSNIAWDKSNDEFMYKYLADNRFDGLEIAPTRLIEDSPYDNIDDTILITDNLKNKFGLDISSMQSIWFGRSEKIFEDINERKDMINYTKKAINYAEAIRCPNLVFGCPRNRNIDDINKLDIAINFFSEIGDYAYKHNTKIALEPNPVIYNTNFLNTTEEAFNFVKKVNSKGLLVNLDLGTIIWNKEDLNKIFQNIYLINHIHISEPNLLKIEKRNIHKKLKSLIIETNYDKYISIEMKNYGNINLLIDTINYVIEVMR